jgi:hypothetical protein
MIVKEGALLPRSCRPSVPEVGAENLYGKYDRLVNKESEMKEYAHELGQEVLNCTPSAKCALS